MTMEYTGDRQVSTAKGSGLRGQEWEDISSSNFARER